MKKTILLAAVILLTFMSLPATSLAVDKNFLVVPGVSVGKITLDMTRGKVISLLGKPTSENDESIEYKSKKTQESITIYFVKDKAVQIDFTSGSYKTEKGISTKNFTENKFAKYFDTYKLKWRFVNLRYSFKKKGLTFYSLNADSADEDYPPYYVGIIHKGYKPLFEALSMDDEKNGGWTSWSGKDIYED